MSRRAAVFVCAVLAATGLSTAAAGAAPTCENIWVRTYEVALDVERHTYRIGDTARVHATVTRADTGAPVAGVRFVALVPYRKTLVMGIDQTNASGQAVAELELKRKHVTPGPARLWGVAYEEVADTTCATVTEYGQKRIRRAFVVKP